MAMASSSAPAQRVPMSFCCAAAGSAAADRPMLTASEAKTKPGSHLMVAWTLIAVMPTKCMATIATPTPAPPMIQLSRRIA